MASFNSIIYPVQRAATLFVAALAGIAATFGLAGLGFSFLLLVVAATCFDRVIAGGAWTHQVSLLSKTPPP